MKKRIVPLFLAAVLFLTMLSSTAQAKDVTASVKKDAGIKKLCKCMDYYAEIDSAFNGRKNYKPKLSDANKIEITCETIVGLGVEDSVISDEKDRKAVKRRIPCEDHEPV